MSKRLSAWNKEDHTTLLFVNFLFGISYKISLHIPLCVNISYK